MLSATSIDYIYDRGALFLVKYARFFPTPKYNSVLLTLLNGGNLTATLKIRMFRMRKLLRKMEHVELGAMVSQRLLVERDMTTSIRFTLQLWTSLPLYEF